MTRAFSRSRRICLLRGRSSVFVSAWIGSRRVFKVLDARASPTTDKGLVGVQEQRCSTEEPLIIMGQKCIDGDGALCCIVLGQSVQRRRADLYMMLIALRGNTCTRRAQVDRRYARSRSSLRRWARFSFCADSYFRYNSSIYETRIG